MSKAVLSRRAADDLQSISDLIAQDSLQASVAVIDYLIDQLGLIAASPMIGRERPDLWPGVLCFSIGKPRWRSRYLIFYRRTDLGIEVARIIEGHRNIAAALEEPPAS